jgi:hypothetical protein
MDSSENKEYNTYNSIEFSKFTPGGGILTAVLGDVIE